MNTPDPTGELLPPPPSPFSSPTPSPNPATESSARKLSAQLEARRAEERRSEERRVEEHRNEERGQPDYHPKYLSLPVRRSRGHGWRNLVWGVMLLLVSGVSFAWALYLAGPSAVFTVAVALSTAAALYVMARSRLLRQRNGDFLAGSMVCLLAVGFVLIQQVWLTTFKPKMAAGEVAAAAAAVPTPAPVASKPAAGSFPSLLEKYPPPADKLTNRPVALVLRPPR